jgi:hypothetical protein
MRKPHLVRAGAMVSRGRHSKAAYLLCVVVWARRCRSIDLARAFHPHPVTSPVMWRDLCICNCSSAWHLHSRATFSGSLRPPNKDFLA